jgi:4-amino-4-deoxy-L-arabinose transferase-like glycosyltransferase
MTATLRKQCALNSVLLSILLLIFVVHILSQAPLWGVYYTSYQQRYNLGGEGALLDSQVYALAGWDYVHGIPPDKINFAHPPLAKYIIGSSELVFNSENLLSVVFGVATLVAVYLIARKILPTYFALVPTFILAFDRMFLWLSSSSMLDIYSTFFAGISVLVFMYFRRSRWLWIPLGVAIGLSFASKWTGIFIVPALLGFAAMRRDRRALLSLALSLPLAALVYTGVYAGYFAAGHSFQDFVALQLRMLGEQSRVRYIRGTPPPFWVLFNFITGIEGVGPWTHLFANWTTRTLDTISVQYGIFTLISYNPLTWPLSFIASVFVLLYAWQHGDREALLPALVFFSVVGAISFGQGFFWYLLPALPFGFISLGYVLSLAKPSWKSSRTKLFLGGYLILVVVWSLYFALPGFVAIR